MRKLTLVLSMLIALVGIHANAAMYIVGSDPFGNWNPGGGVEMTNNGDGTYSYTTTVDGTVYFVFGDGQNNEWSVFNSNYRYGPDNGDTNISAGNWVTTQKAGDHGAYVFSGSGEEYVFTFDETSHRFKVEGNVAPFNPYTGKLFILGQVNGNNWNPTTGIEMNPNTQLSEYIFDLNDVTVTDSGDGYGYFSFTTKLGENVDDWSFLPYRRGAVENGVLVENERKTAMGDWGTANAFKILPGTYDFTVSIMEGEGAYVKAVKKADPEPVVDDVFIIGDVNNFSTAEGWDPTKGAQMTLTDSVYTATVNAVVREGQEYAYFGFSKKIADAESETPWDDIEAFRFGPVSEGDFLMTQELLGTNCALVTDGSHPSIAIPAGEWTVTVNLANNTFSINGEWPVDTVVPEPYTGNVYILGEVNDNAGWFTNKGVLMTRDAENNVYTATITTAGENIPEGEETGYSYFSFTKQLADSAAAWDEIAPYRFGAVSEGDYWVTDEVLGTVIPLQNNGQSFRVPAGKWNLTLSVDNMTLVIEAVVEPTYLRGDVNEDKAVTIADVTALIDILLSGATAPAGADCNLDMAVSIADVTALIDYLLSGSWPAAK